MIPADCGRARHAWGVDQGVKVTFNVVCVRPLGQYLQCLFVLQIELVLAQPQGNEEEERSECRPFSTCDSTHFIV